MSSPITTHVLDTAAGRPAAGVPVRLEIQRAAGEWQQLASAETNDDGRVRDLLPDGHTLQAGVYKLTFDTGAYFRARGEQGFYPHVPVVFELLAAGEHYHVPLLLSPYGYSTYRGS